MSLRQIMIQTRREAEEQALQQKENNSSNNFNTNDTISSLSRPLSSNNATKISCSMKQIGNGKSEEEDLPEPIELPSVGVIALRGKITHNDGKTVLSGQWAMEGVEFTKRRPCTEAFSYVNEQCSANDYSGDYVGGFKYGGTDVVDNNLTLFFVPNNGGSHNVTGSGVNAFGCFDIIGILDQDGGIDMCRMYTHAANTLSVSPASSPPLIAPAKSKTQKTNARKRKKKDKKEENQRHKERKNRNKNKGSSASTSNSDSNNNDVDAERSSGDAEGTANMEVDQVQQPMVIGDENSEEFRYVRNVLNTSGSTSPQSTSQIKDALVRHDNDVERVIDELLPLETSEESSERAVTSPNSAEDDLIKAAELASLFEPSVALIDSQQWGDAVASNSAYLSLDNISDKERADSFCRRALANYELGNFKEALQDYESAISTGQLPEWVVLFQVTRLRSITAIPIVGQRVEVGETMGTICKVRPNADTCDIGVDLDNGKECTVSYPSQGIALLSAAEAELEDIDKIQYTVAFAAELTKATLNSAVYDRVTEIRLSSHTLDNPTAICHVGQTPDIGVDLACLKHDLRSILESRDSFDDASLLHIIRPLIVGIAKFDDTCTPPAPTPAITSQQNVPRPKTLEDEVVLDEQPFGDDDDEVTMDDLRSDTVDKRHSLVTQYVSNNANKKRSGDVSVQGNGGAFYNLNSDLISRLMSMDKLSKSSIREIKAEGISKLSRVRDEVILKLFPLAEPETRQINTAVDYYATAITDAEANGLAALLFNMLCPTPFSKGGRSSAFGGTANDTATFGRCDTIAAQLTLIEVLRSQGRIQLVNSSHLMPVASENSRIDCPLTENDLEEFKKRLEAWTCPCTKQREADIITPISDVYLETQTLLGNPTVVIDGGGRSKSTELMMKRRNPDFIALSINNLGHMQFLNRLEDVAALDDLQVINDAFAALGQALGMPESANTLFDEFCALTLQSPPFSGQSYKNSVIGFASRHVQQYGDEKIFSPKKLVVPVFYDHYARNNTQACINKFDDVTSAADIRLFHLHRLMCSRGGKNRSNKDSDSVLHQKCIENAEKHQAVAEGQFVVSENTTLESRGRIHTKGITLCTICNTELTCYTSKSYSKKSLTNHASTQSCKRLRNNQSEDDVKHLKCIEAAEKHQAVTEGQFVVSEKTTLLSRGSTHTKGITLCTICNKEFSCYSHVYQKQNLIKHASTERCKRARLGGG